jgi:hypothetical protein
MKHWPRRIVFATSVFLFAALLTGLIFSLFSTVQLSFIHLHEFSYQTTQTFAATHMDFSAIECHFSRGVLIFDGHHTSNMNSIYRVNKNATPPTPPKTWGASLHFNPNYAYRQSQFGGPPAPTWFGFGWWKYDGGFDSSFAMTSSGHHCAAVPIALPLLITAFPITIAIQQWRQRRRARDWASARPAAMTSAPHQQNAPNADSNHHRLKIRRAI